MQSKDKHSEHKPVQPPRDQGRDFHSAKEKELRTEREGSKSHSKDSKHNK